jgi:hypothetical protein
LQALLCSVGAEPHDRQIALEFNASEAAVRSAIAVALAKPNGAASAMPFVPQPGRGRKYGWLLGDELVSESYHRGWLDCDGAREVLQRIAQS